MSKGWILIHRQIWDNEYLWDDKPFTRGQAWIDLLLMANHKDVESLKFKMTIKRGQRILSIRQLTERWGWSNTKIVNFLNSLQSAGMIKIESDTKKTVITIANYDFFQDLEKQKRHRNDTETTPKRTNKECKETEEETKEVNTPLPPKDIFENRSFSEPVKAAISDWLMYKKEKRQEYKDTGLRKLLSQIENKHNELSEEQIIYAITESMACNYQGIVWDKAKQQNGNTSAPPTTLRRGNYV